MAEGQLRLVRTRYPGFDILSQKKEWDPHTREIVLKRLGPFPELQFLSEQEADMVRVITKHLVYEERDEIIDFVIHHLDQKLNSNIGESQRSPQAPAAKDLIRWGLAALNQVALDHYDEAFVKLVEKKQFEILAALQQGQVPMVPDWSKVPQQDLFKKLLSEIVPAYYSHPTVWSEIGYGGPAYPRGYYRIEFGLTDPWEAKSDEGK